MKTSINKIAIAFLFSLFSITGIVAQSLDIQLTISPPYPSNLDAYVDRLELGILSVENTTNNSVEAYFQAILEETSGRFSVETDGILGESVTIEPGFNILSPLDVQTIFAGLTENNFTTNGLTEAQIDAIYLSRQMPEGSYRICIKAFNENGTLISNDGLGNCAEFEIQFPERPVILTPFEGEYVDTSGFINPTWDHLLNDANAIVRTEYTLKIIDLTEQEIADNKAIEAMLDPGVSPDYEEELGNVFSTTLQNDIELPLVVGHHYAMRVTAVDPEGFIGYQFGGHSEVVSFYYGAPEEDDDGEEEEEEGNFLAGPILETPESGYLNMLEDPLAIPITWSHELDEEYEGLEDVLTYTLKVVDMDAQVITNITLDDFEDDNFEYLLNTPILNYDTVLISTTNFPLVRDHQYAIAIKVESEDDRFEFENDGYTDLATFIIGEEEEVADAEEGCGGICMVEEPTNQVSKAFREGDKLTIGHHTMVIEQVVKDLENGGYLGEAHIVLDFIREIKIKVTFEGLEANKDKVVYRGSANAVYNETITKAAGLVATGASNVLDIDFEAAKTLSSTLASTGQLASILAGRKATLPLGFDKDVGEDKMIIGITEMEFTPTKASLTALFSIENPDWGDYIPTLGATNICFTPTGFGNVVKLILADDYNIPLSNEQLVLKASEANTSDEKGTYVMVDCNGFKEGQLTGEIGIPREVLLPEDEDGSVLEDGFSTLTVSGTFLNSNGYMLSAALSPSQIPGLEGFSLEVSNGYYDASDEINPTDMIFPQGYSRSAADVTWKGVWFETVSLKAPADWGFAGKEERSSININNFIKDDVGISLIGSAENLLSIDKGEFEGFAISIDAMNINIIRGEFIDVNMVGLLGLPILPADSYLSYEGIIDRMEADEDEEDNNVANNNQSEAEGESLSMTFTVTPDEDGYDLDWIKSHLQFADSTEIVLINNAEQRGIEATISGEIKIKSTLDDLNASRDAGMPELDIPGLTFEGMELKKMKYFTNDDDDNNNNAGNNNEDSNPNAFQFTAPAFSFLGVELDAIQDRVIGEEDEDEEEEDEEEEDEEKQAKLNGFGLNIDHVGFTNGDGEELEGFEQGSLINFSLAGNVMLVRGKNKENMPGVDEEEVNEDNEGMAISAAGGFTIGSIVNKEGNKMSLAFESFGMDSLSIDAQVSAIKLKGKVGFYQDDEDFGNGALGNLEVTLPMITLGLDGRFGSLDDYNYWYLFANLKKEKQGQVHVPIANFGPVNFYGFNGGAYYHMTDVGGATPEERYVPNEETLIGFEAGTTMSVVDPKTIWGAVTMGMEFNEGGGLSLAKVYGDAYILKPEMEERGEDDEVEGIEANLDARLNINDEDIDFNATMDVFANVAEGAFVGRGTKDGVDNYVVKSTLSIDKDDWHFYIGRPDTTAAMRVQIPGLEDEDGNSIAGIDISGYLMMGSGTMPEATLPTPISDLLTKVNENFKGGRSSASFQRKGGFAMGAFVEAEAHPKASILYADLWAGLGFDLSLSNFGNTVCSNNDNELLGINGWYADGSIYAGVTGDVGLDIDIDIYTGKISLIDLGAVLRLKGGFPSPAYASGQAGMYYDVLGGVVEGTTYFEVSVGEPCVPNIKDPFAGINFIADITPAHTPQRGDVSVFVKPQMTLNQPLGEYSFSVPGPEGKRVYQRFKVEIKNFEIRNSINRKWDDGMIQTVEKVDDLTYRVVGDKMLKDKVHVSAYVELQAFRWTNGKWEVLIDSKTNRPWKEIKEHKFQTGVRPDNVPFENVVLTYPMRNEPFYLHGNNTGKKGLVQLIAPQNYLFESQFDKKADKSKEEWKDIIRVNYYKIQYGKAELKETNTMNHMTGNILEFNMPYSLDKKSVYQIQVVRTFVKNPSYDASFAEVDNVTVQRGSSSFTIKKEGLLYTNYVSAKPPDVILCDFKFGTSLFNNFAEKINANEHHIISHKDYSYDGKSKPTIEYVLSEYEGWSEQELDAKVIQESGSESKGYLYWQEDFDNEYYKYILDPYDKIAQATDYAYRYPDHFLPEFLGYSDFAYKAWYNLGLPTRRNPVGSKDKLYLHVLDFSGLDARTFKGAKAHRISDYLKTIKTSDSNIKKDNLSTWRGQYGYSPNFQATKSKDGSLWSFVPALAQMGYPQAMNWLDAWGKCNKLKSWWVELYNACNAEKAKTQDKFNPQNAHWNNNSLDLTVKYFRPIRKNDSEITTSDDTYIVTFKKQ